MTATVARDGARPAGRPARTTTRTASWAPTRRRTARRSIRTLRPEASSAPVVIGATPGTRCSASTTAACSRPWSTAGPTDYRLEVTYGVRHLHRRRPVPLAADARRDRPAPDRRGPAREPVGGARRARAHLRHPRRRRSPARRSRCGRRTRGACASPATSTTGPAARCRCARSARSGVWEIFVPERRRRRALQVPDPRRRRPVARQGRPDGVRHARRRRRPRRWSPPRATSGPTTSGSSAGAQTAVAQGADVDLRGAHRLVADRAVLPRSSPTSSSTTSRDTGFTHVEFLPVAEHPFGGSWGYQVSSYYAPSARFGSPGRVPLPRRRAAPGRHRRASSTGCPRTSPRTSSRSAASTARRSTSTATRAAASSSDWGTYVFDFGRTRGAQLPRRQRAVLARGVPHRRAARRRRRLDALPRLLAPEGGSGRRTSTAAGRTSRPSRSCRR